MKNMYFAALDLAAIFFPGCAPQRSWRGLLNPKAFMGLSIGTEKQKVIDLIGKPDVIRGSMINKLGQSVEVWEYIIDSHFFCAFCDTYWLYFHDNKLVQWNRAGDFQKESDNIQEIRFR